ncbi:response regulator transcription factor [Dethiosulfovibrio sp. F2B]|uniref:response regulator n=1 Tax=Dethiosulfovibrio faecalis TaxID=2720018 RepID=UPI001F200CAD|nr:response regulator transcription factor [Dethiosulfovibrio faecalis]MCF4152393.1 response regulator transcription factor [Dethiosulfovibrio faecalis]
MTTILLADDHTILREGLRSLLGRQQEMTVIAEASNGLDAVRLAESMQPDVIVMDVMMPEMNGIDAARTVRLRGICSRIVALSMYANANFVSEMFKAGATGFLMKDCAFDELAEAVKTVAQGKTYIGPRVREMLSDIYLESMVGDIPQDETYELSTREIEVLRLLGDGLTNKEAAEKLHLSVNTVACHRQNIMKKLNLKNTVDLTKYAIRKGYVGF